MSQVGEFDKGWIEIKRKSQYYGKIRTFDIYIDGDKVGAVKDGETEVIEVSCGSHKVTCKVDWYETSPVELHINAGDRVKLYCGSRIEGWKVMFALFLSFVKGQVIYLSPTPES